MASSAQSLQHNRLMVEAKIKSLINNDLKEICRGENLAVSGVKAQLQSRILDRTSYHCRPLTPALVTVYNPQAPCPGRTLPLNAK